LPIGILVLITAFILVIYFILLPAWREQQADAETERVAQLEAQQQRNERKRQEEAAALAKARLERDAELAQKQIEQRHEMEKRQQEEEVRQNQQKEAEAREQARREAARQEQLDRIRAEERKRQEERAEADAERARAAAAEEAKRRAEQEKENRRLRDIDTDREKILAHLHDKVLTNGRFLDIEFSEPIAAVSTPTTSESAEPGRLYRVRGRRVAQGFSDVSDTITRKTFCYFALVSNQKVIRLQEAKALDELTICKVPEGASVVTGSPYTPSGTSKPNSRTRNR
jgi:hypothetical protein